MVRHLNHCVSTSERSTKRLRRKDDTLHNVDQEEDGIILQGKETAMSMNNVNDETFVFGDTIDDEGATNMEKISRDVSELDPSNTTDLDNDQIRREIKITSHLWNSNQVILADKQHDFEIDILKFCNKIDAPLYAYDELMKVMNKHKVLDNVFPAGGNSRSSLFKHIKNKHTFLKDAEPIIKVARLADGREVDVVTFDFLAMLTSLLNDGRCMKDENLTFPSNDPYCHPRETGMRNEVHSGTWYQNVWDKRWKRHGDIIVGIIFFIDKTYTDMYGRLNLLPVQFTLSIFNLATRATYQAWRPLGYINDLKIPGDPIVQSQSATLKGERNVQNFHSILNVVLQSLEDVQKKNDIKFDLIFRDKTYNLNLIPVVGPIIGDSEEHDTIVGRYGCYNRVSRICRYCDCSFDNSDNPHVEFIYTKQKDIRSLYTRNTEVEGRLLLRAISYHRIDNGFHSLDFGDDERGLHGLCPAEMLHCVRLGLFKMAVTCFFNFLQPRHRAEMDRLLTTLGRQYSHQSYRDMPRTSFKFTISDLTKITAGEWTGIILLLTTSLLTNAGGYIWRDGGNSNATRNEFIKLFDRLLILEKWLQSTEGYTTEELATVGEKIKTFLDKYKKICRRQEGNEMKILKYHMMVHIVDDIIRFGVPQNVNGGPCESNFIPQKRESKRTQRRAETFIKQMATRIHENLIFAHAIDDKHYEADEDNSKSGVDNIPVGGSKFILRKMVNSNSIEVTWKGTRDEQQGYPLEIIEFVFNSLAKSDDDIIHCFTEHKCNGRIFRADCSYRGKEAWYDWATVVWAKQDNEQVHMFAKIHMFIDGTKTRYEQGKMVNGMRIEGGQVYALISSLKEERPMPKGVSKLFLQGTMYKENDEVMYYIIPVETINETAIVVQDVNESTMIPQMDAVLIMKPCELWKNGIGIIDQF